MKIITFLSMLLFCSICNGQVGGKRMDSIMRMMKDSGLVTWSPKGSGTLSAVKARNIGVTNNDTVIWAGYRIDTFKVMLLICDTSFYEASATTGIRDTVIHIYNTQTYWQYGYKVIEESWGKWFCNEYYLDKNKLPLPKSIIVWQSKEYYQ